MQVGAKIDYEVIATGSKGNAVLLGGEILVDCGVSYKSVASHSGAIKIVLLTHRHQDHVNISTVRRLAYERPTLRWGVPPWLVADVVACGVSKKNIDVLEMNVCMSYGDFTVQSVSLTHNVPNCAYKIHFKDVGSVFYATDTNSLSGIEAKGYTLYLLEANYTEEEILERIRTKQDEGKYCHEWDVLKYHLSEQKALDFIYQNAGPNSEYVLLHRHEESRAA